MNYEDKTNRWIAIEVAKRLGKRVSTVTEFHEGDGCVVYPHDNQINFDPCNNPSDAWFIIASNDINLSKHKADDYWFAFVRAEDLGVSEFKCKDKNPLRAAMICFLKMKDSEK